MIRVRQIKVLVEKKSEEEIKRKLAKKLDINIDEIIDFNIIKESIDARKKEEIFFVYEIDANITNEDSVLNKKNNDIFKSPSLEYKLINKGEKLLNNRPIIVGSGPSGLFAALILAENGLKPLVIEQGSMIEKRVEEVEKFISSGELNEYSNVQFGEGGAGTFSDGKLNTLVKDENNRGRKVFETFVECGADKDILYSYKPHIGTDLLRVVVRNLRNKIISLGGEFRFNTKLTNIFINNEKIESIEVNNNEIIKTDVLVLAIGNGARDTYKMLSNYLSMSSKPFAVGLRIMHDQKLIDASQFGEKYKDILSPATYKLTYQTKDNRGVYTFCMCPGGYVINSSSENDGLVINGMSYHKRDSGVANSAIVVTVNEKDYGASLFDGLDFQKDLERKAYLAGCGKIPVQKLSDFYNNEVSKIDGDIKIMGSYLEYNINEIIPDFISSSIKEAIENFDTKIKGFKNDNAILAAVETRTSSPIRINRSDSFESNIEGIYPIGEGAGYAGGITSSAIDGIKIAEAILNIYKGVIS